ncbi:hypothetical protein N7466_011193 [Penicillium verhagenii]|uniref:uncharacterized protein n=1 Tax=Penicillium verhagenii TaxID=1562060 RepID=UPI00254535EB|nr:uncharacterized protein N7466_011193 [Penicillium verhagenii]KAJ5917639.1 hypothetical protein N7466_011193 [Penicillium verhagenii]
MPRKSQKKQTRLSFAAIPSAPSGEGSEEDSERFRTLSYGHPSLASVRPKKLRKAQAASPEKSSFKKETGPKLKEESENEVPKRLKKASTQSSQSTESSDNQILVSSGSKRRRRVPANFEIETAVSASKADNPKNEKKSRRRAPSPVQPAEPEETPRPRRKLKRKAESSPVINLDSSDSEQPVITPSAQPVDEEETPRQRRRLKRKAESSPVINLDSDDSEEPVMSSPVKRKRLIAGPRTPETPRGSGNQDDMDIEEDVKDLEDSVVKKTRTRGHLHGSARDKRFKTLEAIRRKRLGLKPESDDELSIGSEEEENQDTPDEQEAEGDEEEDNNSDAESAHPSNEDLDAYEDDFVLDDDSVLLGVPTEEIPLEFTRHAYKKPKDYFRDVVGWMVLNRLDPAFPRSDAMYEMAFMKLEDEVKGRAGSQLISSVWNADFRYSLLARPQIEITSYPTFDDHPCDACNRSGHPASVDMKLYGKPYSLQTLEALHDSDADTSSQSQANDSDSDEEGSKARGVDKDRQGHKLPDENSRFLLGRQCAAKSRLAHTLTHWRYHLNEWVVDYLDRMGHMADAEVLRRNALSQKRKTRNGIAVLEGMVEAGEVEKLWRDFHKNLKSARDTM